ncbi:MAG: penicillin acylase family protein [Bacteroidetes Order II. Incertae sedis bacterium]|nr:penicillin acylase family protein [Bacteroidetes Order II. bacterium]
MLFYRFRNIIALSLLIAIVGLFILGITFWFSYGFRTDYSAQVKITNLRGNVSVEWRKDRIPVIRASSENDGLAGLGYSHALRHALPMSVWRQVALGELGQWFQGDSTAIIDRVSKTLGIGKLAYAAYRQLKPEEKNRLIAYSNGVNAVLEHPNEQVNDDLLLSGLKPKRWEPWHSLAVEHLLAWIGAEPYKKTLADTLQPAFEKFMAEQRVLKQFLRLHGFEHGLAWVSRQSRDTYFFHRHVYGASAWPLVQEAIIDWGIGQNQVVSVPGTLLFPSGRNERLSWFFLLTSPFSAERLPAGADSLVVPENRVIKDMEGNESLVTTRSNGNSFFLPESFKKKYKKMVQDTLLVERDTTVGFVWKLNWPGFRPLSDQSIFRNLLVGDTTGVNFHLFKGNGLLLTQDGRWSVRGKPLVREELPNGLLISDTPWASHSATRLRQVLSSGLLPQQFLGKFEDTYSPFVRPAVKGLLGMMEKRKDLTYAAKDALTYLRNWKFDFSNESIAASVFDAWMAEYYKGWSYIPKPDSTMFAGADSAKTAENSLKLKKTLIKVVSRFKDKESSPRDFSSFQWGLTQAGEVYYPIWSAQFIPLYRHNLAQTRFSPVRVAHSGHPTTLQWRATRMLTDLPSPSVWEGWFANRSSESWMIQRANLIHEEMLSRYSIPDRQQYIELDASGDVEVIGKTQLVPAE